MNLEIEYAGVIYRWDGQRWTDPNNEIAPRAIAAQLDALARAQLDAQDDQILRPSDITREAQVSARQGNLRRGLRLARKAFEERPDEGRAATLISVLRRAHRYDDALDVFGRFPEPEFLPLLTTSVALMVDIERWQDAQRLANRAVALHGPPVGELRKVINRLDRVRPTPGVG